MKNLDQLSLSNAEMIYMVANTPMFIVRKLREDPDVVKLGRSYTADELKKKIIELLEINPEDARARVLPFVLLTALFLKNDTHGLQELMKLDSSKYRWFGLVLDAFVKTSMPTTSLIISPAFANSVSKYSPTRLSSNNTKTINLGGA